MDKLIVTLGHVDKIYPSDNIRSKCIQGYLARSMKGHPRSLRTGHQWSLSCWFFTFFPQVNRLPILLCYYMHIFEEEKTFKLYVRIGLVPTVNINMSDESWL